MLEGIIYFQEYRDLDFIAGIVFFAALLVIFFGVYLLSSGNSGSKSYAPVPSNDGSEESWDPADPTTPRCAMPDLCSTRTLMPNWGSLFVCVPTGSLRHTALRIWTLAHWKNSGCCCLSHRWQDGRRGRSAG